LLPEIRARSFSVSYKELRMTQPVSPIVERHLAVDLHKHYLVIGGVNARQEVVLSPRRVNLDEWLTWAKTNLTSSDALVVEATTNTWWFYDQTYQSVGQVLVADPRKIAWIAQTKVKTDAHDVMKLARLSAAGLIPLVWVPPLPVRELRALLAHRRRLVRTQTVLSNRRFAESFAQPVAPAPDRAARGRPVLRQAPRVVGCPPGFADRAVACAARPRDAGSGRRTARRD
jgi:transposase